jgi:RimJ/RimL family protein N-acetyltransferase
MAVTHLTLARWQSVSPADREAVVRLRIAPQQLEYAGTVERAIASCETGPSDQVAGLVIKLSEVPVGFVVLSRGDKRPAWAPEGAVALTAMRIDLAHQGQGVGRRALQGVTAWIAQHWPESAVLALCVDDENQAGKQAYLRAGFAEYTPPRQGRIGLVRYLSKTLNPSPSSQ